MNTRETFYLLLNGVKRDGIKEFIDWLFNETDFTTAPASSRFHGNYEGGLIEHSVQVCYNLLMIDTNDNYDSKIIVSLLHDICKANFYEEDLRNVKNKETGIWEQKPFYKINEQFPFGAHGGKSVYLILQHGIKLTDEEATAINCHMGGWDVTTYHSPSGAFEKYPLAVYLHIADMMATYLNKT